MMKSGQTKIPISRVPGLAKACGITEAAYELRPVFDALVTDLKQSTKLFVPSRQIAMQSPAG